MKLDKDIFLRGNDVTLRVLNEEDINGNYASWLNNPEITQYNSHGRFPMTIDKLKEFVKSAYTSNNSLIFAIQHNETNAHVGNISLQNISWIDRNAEIAFILGEKDYWGKGIMLDAGRLMITHAFNVLNLHRVYCGTSSENIGMQKLATKLGMLQEGVRKDALFKNGHYVDIIEYGVIRDEIL